jgi:hypothetical protein
VFLQPVAKTKNGRFIWQAGELLQLGKFAVQRGIEEGFLHGGVRQREPLLHEVDAQYRQQRKGWPPGTAFGAVRGNELDQRRLWHHLFYLRQERWLTGLLHAEIEV